MNGYPASLSPAVSGHVGALFLGIWGTWTIDNTPVDALPDCQVWVIVGSSLSRRLQIVKPGRLSAATMLTIFWQNAWFQFGVRYVCLLFLKTAYDRAGRSRAWVLGGAGGKALPAGCEGSGNRSGRLPRGWNGGYLEYAPAVDRGGNTIFPGRGLSNGTGSRKGDLSWPAGAARLACE